MFHRFLVLFTLLLSTPIAAGNQVPFLLVTDAAEDTVRKYALDGTYLGTVFEPGAGGVDQPLGMTLAPDGTLLVSGDLSGDVHRFDLATGESLGIFATHSTMVGPAGMKVHDGNLYVSDGRTGRVFRFDAGTGDYVDTFITGMRVPEGLVWDGQGNLLVGDWLRSEIRVYDEDTGEFKERLVRGDGLNRPLHMALSDSGDSVLSANLFGNTITEHSLSDGSLLRTIDLREGGADVSGPVSWIDLPDGTKVVSSTNNGTLFRYDTNWDYLGVFAQGNATRAGAMVLVLPAPGAAAITLGFVPIVARRPRRVV